jgi:hypothetical protein
MVRSFISLGLSAVLVGLFASPAFAGNGEALVARVPAGMEGVVSVDVQRLRTAPVFADLTSVITSTSDYRSSIGTLTSNGVTFDPTTDVHTILLAFPDADNTPDPDDALALIEATFNTDQVLAAAAANNYTVQTSGDVRYFVARDRTVALLDATTVAIGPNDRVMQIVNAMAGNGSLGVGPSLRTQVRGADKSEIVWFAMVRPNATAGIQAAHGGATIAATFSAEATGTAVSAAEATRLVTEGNAQRHSAASDPAMAAFGLAPVLAAVTLEAADTSVNVGLSLNAATWASLSAQLLAVLESEL